MSILHNKCQICYNDIREADSKKYCNNCGNDYHEKCIIQIKDNKCPNCHNLFTDGSIKKHYPITKKSTLPRSTRQMKTAKGGYFKWWHPLPMLELFAFIAIGPQLEDGNYVYAFMLFLMLSILALAISPLISWGLNGWD